MQKKQSSAKKSEKQKLSREEKLAYEQALVKLVEQAEKANWTNVDIVLGFFFTAMKKLGCVSEFTAYANKYLGIKAPKRKPDIKQGLDTTWNYIPDERGFSVAVAKG